MHQESHADQPNPPAAANTCLCSATYAVEAPRLDAAQRTMEGCVPPSLRPSNANSAVHENDGSAPAGSASESRPVGATTGDGDRVDARTAAQEDLQRSAIALTAPAIPARLAWSPDPAWAAGSGSHDDSGTVGRLPDASRKRARKGRVKKAARKAAPTGGRAASSQPAASLSHGTEALGHPLAGDVWWQQRPVSRESAEAFSECDCSDLEQYYDSDDDWVDSEVEGDNDNLHTRFSELQATPLRRSIMDQSLSDLQDAPPVFPTPRRPDAVDLERHRSLTESIESLIHKSEQKDLINSAAKEVFDRFNRGEDGRISQLEFCTLVQVSEALLLCPALLYWL